jgi:polar amino acid transport system permease protein
MDTSYHFDWTVITNSFPQLLSGLGTTIEISLITIALSLVLAVPVAVARMSRIDLVRWIAQGYIELFRCTPMLVQLFWIYYALPTLTGITLGGFTSAFIALTANLTAFLAETYRSGFQSVPAEQIEAGKMLQLNRIDILIRIIVPQAIRQQLPVILSQTISLFKDTALVSTIAVADLMFQANTIAVKTYKSLEIYTAVAAIYFVIAFPVSLVVNNLERRQLSSDGGSGGGRKGKKRKPDQQNVETVNNSLQGAVA